jgi:holin-like protein
MDGGMQTLRGFVVLLLCQSAGEALARLLGLRLPGPVLGMLVLLALLAWPPVRTLAAAAADALLPHLSLLFVPIGVGVVVHLGVLAEQGLRIAAVIVVSTLAGLVVTAMLLRWWCPAMADPAPEAPLSADAPEAAR